MGLDISIKGLERKDTYHGGYCSFNLYREKVAYAYNKRIRRIIRKRFL